MHSMARGLLTLSAGYISSHMTRLGAAGFVEVEKSFADRKPRTVYRITKKGRSALDAYRIAIDSMLAPAAPSQ